MTKDTASRFLDFLDSSHPNIKFTMELEGNLEIPFLDVSIKRDHDAFSTTVHHKKTFTDLYTKWDCFTPRKYKINLIWTLTYPLLTHHFIAVDSELKNSLLQNVCPRGIINYNVNDVLNKRKDRPLEPTLKVPKRDVILVLLCLGLHTDSITRRLKSCVKTFYGFNSSVSGLFLQNTSRIKSFFRRLSTKPVFGIVMLSTLVKPEEDCITERRISTSTESSHSSWSRLRCCWSFNFYRSQHQMGPFRDPRKWWMWFTVWQSIHF